MVFRYLFQYLANNERLVRKIADSKPIRRAAQMVVYCLNKTSSMSGSHQLPQNSKEFSQQIFSIAKQFSSNITKELKDAKDELKKKQSK